VSAAWTLRFRQYFTDYSNPFAMAPVPSEEAAAMQSPTTQRRTLRVLLIEDDPIDATWITELIKGNCPISEVVHRASLPDALSALDQQPIDTVFVSVHPDGKAPSIQECREIVRRAGRRSVVALIDAAEMARASEVRATGVKFVYRKHPIWRTAQIRRQELREKLSFGEVERPT
jgi:CheY-like chemotaxis protein